MQLPEEILNKIIEISYDMNKKDIAKNFRVISDKYMGDKKGESLLNKEKEAIAYSIARMPATYGAVKVASMQMLELIKLDNIRSLIDVGAGTGAATLALVENLQECNNIEQITCLEREDAMIKIGKSLYTETTNDVLKKADWVKFDINQVIISQEKKDEIKKNKENLQADIVVTSYMLNEFADDKVLEVVDKLWEMTCKVLLIVDPGTPKDHKRLIMIKNYLAKKGGTIIAPCTCNTGCPLNENDWCHFVCRVERTKLQKQVKNGDVPYEDEKFTYLAVSKEKIESVKNLSRVIRHPITRSNMVEIKLCLNGEIVNKIYTKKDKELYKQAKKAKVGDLLV